MSQILSHLLEIASEFSAQEASPDDQLFRDLNINGADFLEFVIAVEQEFGVNLNWVSPLHGQGEPYDPTLAELARFIDRGERPTKPNVTK